MAEVSRIITPHDLVVANRLNKLFLHKKQTTGLTQSDLAHKLGITQPTISQYLKGTIALRNAKTLCAFADALGVSPKDIDPKLDIRFPTLPKAKSLTEDLDAFTIDGRTANAASPFAKLANTAAYTVIIDERYEPLWPKNSRFIVDPASVLRKNQLCAILKKDGSPYAIYTLKNMTPKSAEVYMLHSEVLRAAMTKKGFNEEELNTLSPSEPLIIPLNSIENVHRIRGIEFPN